MHACRNMSAVKPTRLRPGQRGRSSRATSSPHPSRPSLYNTLEGRVERGSEVLGITRGLRLTRGKQHRRIWDGDRSRADGRSEKKAKVGAGEGDISSFAVRKERGKAIYIHSLFMMIVGEGQEGKRRKGV